RWLKAGVEQEDGSIVARTKGTPQGGVISPLLSNLYLHHAFDKWMETTYPHTTFERYADDIVIHCDSKAEAEKMRADLEARMQGFELTLHPEKTKIVYCKNYQRHEKYDNESFTFLSYSFQPRTMIAKFGKIKRILVFGCAICNVAKTSIRTAVKEVLRTEWSTQTLEWFAAKLNPKLRGWINYYSKFNSDEAYRVFTYLNELIRKWIKNTFKLRGKDKLYKKYQQIQAENPSLFYHWKIGIKA
ncbi:MAG: reverse transcriptase domain-containing protein, partial [Cyclobacteriaceae bacterium]|nr:reverse transcriptase domain-containing protein [Cyclobacteriaceae bacterium]